MRDLTHGDPAVRLLDDLESLWRLSEAVSKARSVKGILDAALDALERIIRVDRSAVLLFDPEGHLRFEAWRGLSDRYRKAVEGHSPWTADAQDPEPILVTDPSSDPSLSALIDVIGSEGISSLAFIPLVTKDKLIGKFMLYFDEPHGFSREEVRIAKAIGSHIAFAIERRETEESLQRSQALLDVITQGLADGITVQGPQGVIYANVAAARMTGLDTPEDLLRTPMAKIAERFEMFDEDGRPFDPEHLPGRRALNGEPAPEALIEVRDRQTGDRHWRAVRARPVPGLDGNGTFAVNIVTDLTEQKQLEHDLRLQKTLLELQSEGTLEGILVVSPEGRIISFNRRFAEMWGIPGVVLASKNDDSALGYVRDKLEDPDGFYERVRFLYEHPMEQSRDEIQLRDGRLFDRYSAPIVGGEGTMYGRAWFFRDVSDRKRAQDEQRFLAEAGEVLGSSLNYERTLRRVANLAVRGIADWCVVYLHEGSEVRRLEVAHRDPSKRDEVEEFARRYPPDPSSPDGIMKVIGTGEPLVIPEITREMIEAGARDEEHLALLRSLGFESAIILPLRARGSVVGAIAFVSAGSGKTYTEDDLPFHMELARRAAAAIDRARLYSAQREARRHAEAAVERTSRMQAITAALASAIASEDVARVVLEQGMSALSADAGAVYMLDAERKEYTLLSFVGYPAERAPEFQTIPSDVRGPLHDAVQAGEPVVASSPEDLVERWPWLAAAQAESGDQATITAPLVVWGQPIGALHVAFRRPVSLNEDDVAFIASVARQLAQALDRAVLYEREKEIAITLQKQLLPPKLPEIPGLELSAAYLPFGEGVVVGGDLFDVFEASDGKWLALIADVSGRGPRAAGAGHIVRQAVRVTAIEGRSPSEILSLANRVLLGQVDDESFCTACCVLIERGAEGFTLRLCSGGHPLPVTLSSDGRITPQGRPGSLLGVFEDASLSETSVVLRPGEALVLFTDGLIERRRDGEHFGDTRMYEVLRSVAAEPADKIVEALRQELLSFGAEPLADDVAILALRVPPAG